MGKKHERYNREEKRGWQHDKAMGKGIRGDQHRLLTPPFLHLSHRDPP